MLHSTDLWESRATQYRLLIYFEREQLGGYFLIEAKNLDEAIDIAAQIPGFRAR